jgi:hypothetical protein
MKNLVYFNLQSSQIKGSVLASSQLSKTYKLDQDQQTMIQIHPACTPAILPFQSLENTNLILQIKFQAPTTY